MFVFSSPPLMVNGVSVALGGWMGGAKLTSVMVWTKMLSAALVRGPGG
jgi:hypothetical protein